MTLHSQFRKQLAGARDDNDDDNRPYLSFRLRNQVAFLRLRRPGQSLCRGFPLPNSLPQGTRVSPGETLLVGVAPTPGITSDAHRHGGRSGSGQKFKSKVSPIARRKSMTSANIC